MTNLTKLLVLLVGISCLHAHEEHHYHKVVKLHHQTLRHGHLHTRANSSSDSTDKQQPDHLTFSFNSSSNIGRLLNATAEISALIDIKANITVIFNPRFSQLIAINLTNQAGQLFNSTNITTRIQDTLSNITSLFTNTTGGLNFNSSALPQEVQKILTSAFGNSSTIIPNLQSLIYSISKLPIISQINSSSVNGLNWLTKRFEGLSAVFERFRDHINPNVTIDFGRLLLPFSGTRTCVDFFRQLTPFFRGGQSFNFTQLLPVIQQIGGNSSGFDNFIHIISQFGNSSNCSSSVESLLKFFNSTQNISSIQQEFTKALQDGLGRFLPFNSSIITDLLQNNTKGPGDSIIKFLASLDRSNISSIQQTFLPFIQNLIKNGADSNGLSYLRLFFPLLNIRSEDLKTIVEAFKKAGHNGINLAQNADDIYTGFVGLWSNPFFNYLNDSLSTYTNGAITIPEFFKPSNLANILPSFYLSLANLTVNAFEDNVDSFLNVLNPSQNKNETNPGPLSGLLHLLPGAKQHHSNKEHHLKGKDKSHAKNHHQD